MLEAPSFRTLIRQLVQGTHRQLLNRVVRLQADRRDCRREEASHA